jgi:hypothetical protein
MLNEDIYIKDETHYLEEFHKCNGTACFILPKEFSYEKLNKLASEMNLFFVEPKELKYQRKIYSPNLRRKYYKYKEPKDSHVLQ